MFSFWKGLATKWKIVIILGVVLILAGVGVGLWLLLRKRSLPPAPPVPPAPPTPVNPDVQSGLAAALGTGVLDAFPNIATDLTAGSTANGLYDNTSPYPGLMSADTLSVSQAGPDPTTQDLVNYLSAVYYPVSIQSLQSLTLDQLTAWYRSQVFFYITEPQPDGGWDGAYWSKRALPGVDHDKTSGCTNGSAMANEAFLFDEAMSGGAAATRSDLWANHIFIEPFQATLRRGMINSFSETVDNSYGTGGFPSFVYLEMLQFPQEHPTSSTNPQMQPYVGGMGNPTGCTAANMNSYAGLKCPSGLTSYPCPNSQTPLPNSGLMFQPPASASQMPSQSSPQWFYFSQGLGQWWNLGRTAYCYNYVDMFLNSPNTVGWQWMYPGPKAGGQLGFNKLNQPKEHDTSDPVYSIKLILEYLSRVVYPSQCVNTSVTPNKTTPAGTDPNTGLVGLGFCTSPCTGSVGGQPVCSPASQASFGTSVALHKQLSALMGVENYWTAYASAGPTGWADSCVPTASDPVYPTHTDTVTVKDNRYLVTGWVNGNFYGYPKGDCLCASPSQCQQYQGGNVPQGPGTYTPTGEAKCSSSTSSGSCNPMRGGVPGIDPATGDVIFGKNFTQASPLVYYNAAGVEICRTWYGCQLQLDEPTALALLAEMYSRGDTGAEAEGYNWPFGSYFSYGQDLGGPGKDLAGQLASPYSAGVNTIQFTMTPTAFSTEDQPAYDFEIMYMPLAEGGVGAATCAAAVAIDLLADFTSSTPGQDLIRYCNLNKGQFGGYIPVDSPAGQSAIPFDGTQMKVSNFTTVSECTGTGSTSKCLAKPSFTLGKPNQFNPAITNVFTTPASLH